MATTVSLTEVKTHLRITNSNEDTVIATYIAAADDHIANFLNKSTFRKTNAVKAAALLIVGDLYENREATSDKEYKTNPAVENLLFPYRVNMGI